MSLPNFVPGITTIVVDVERGQCKARSCSTQTDNRDPSLTDILRRRYRRRLKKMRSFSFRKLTGRQISIFLLFFGFLLVVSAVFVGFQTKIFPNDDKLYLTLDDVGSNELNPRGFGYSFGVDLDGSECMIVPNGPRLLKYSIPSLSYAGVIYDLTKFNNPSNVPTSANFFRTEMNQILYVTAVGYSSIPYKMGRSNYVVYDSYDMTARYATNNATDKLNCLRFAPGFQQTGNTFSSFTKRDGYYYIMAMVRDYNIFIRDYVSDREYKVTFGTDSDNIRYGSSFGSNIDSCSVFWSPDQIFLAFYYVNGTLTTEYNLSFYDIDNPFVRISKATYSIPGFPRTATGIGIHNLITRQTRYLDISSIPNESYFQGISWVNRTHFSFSTTARVQTRVSSWVVSAANMRLTLNQTFSSGKGWLQMFSTYTQPNMRTYFKLTPHPDYNSHYHIALYNRQSNTILGWITEGFYDVTEINYYQHPEIWYTANDLGVLGADLYLHDMTTEETRRISSGKGLSDATFSFKGDWFMLKYQGPEIPTLTLHKRSDPGQTWTLIDNSQIKNNMKKYHIPEKRYIKIPTDHEDLYGIEIRPPNFSPVVKYPVVIYVYNGPESRMVTYSWSIDYHSFLATQGFLVYMFDSRGTTGRGENFLKSVYGNLGIYETEDLFSLIDHIKSLDYVDVNNIGLWGWSYGGYMTLMGVSDPRGAAIKAAVAIAPVVDWRLYQTTYTERYMGDSVRNAGGYQITSVLNRAQNIRSKLLIAHGTGDDNVHYQHTALLLEKLVEFNVDFDALPYTNENHNLGKSYSHVYMKMIQFWLDNLHT